MVGSYQIRVTLEVKAESAGDAKMYTEFMLGKTLNNWLCNGTRQPPFPSGTLLFWTVTDSHKSAPTR